MYALIAASLVAGRARAQEPRAQEPRGQEQSAATAGENAPRLEWEAPKTCPRREDVLRAVGQLTARGKPIDVAAAVEPAGTQWTIRLSIGREGGSAPRTERILSAESCRAAADVVAYIIAVAMDPTLDAAPPKTEPNEPTPTQAEPRPKTQWAIALFGGGDLGLLPSLGAGAALQLSLRAQWFRAALDAHGSLPQTVGDSVDLTPLGASLRGCFHPLALESTFQVSPCLGAAAEGVRSSSPLGSTFVPWVAALASVEASAATKNSNVFIAAKIDAAFPIARPEFLAQNRVLHRVSPIFGRMYLGVGVFF